MSLDISISLFILFVGLSLSSFFNLEKTDKINLRILWVYHLIFSLYYCTFLKVDDYAYWRVAQNMASQEFWSFLSIKGTYMIYALCYFPVKILGLSYFTTTMMFSLVGYIGLTFFYLIVIKLIPYNTQFKKIFLFPILFFLPNLHLWSVAIGKDALCFFCIGAFAYGLLNIRNRWGLIVFAIILSYFVRPHIALLILSAFSIAFLISPELNKYKRIFLSILLVTIGILMLPSILEYFKIEDLSASGIDQFSDKTAQNMSAGAGSAIDISSYPYPLKMFTFLYRPLFFDINGLAALIISFENLFLILLSLHVLKNRPIRTFKEAPLIIQGLFIFLIIGTLVFCSSMSNLGIIIRMRNMFLPGMLIYILWAFSYNAKCNLDENE